MWLCMPMVPYMPLSAITAIGAAPYWQAVASSLPIISAPPSPMKATTCVPGRRIAAATAIGMPEPIAPTTDARNTCPCRKPIWRCRKVAKLPASEVTVASGARCLPISATTAEKFTPSSRGSQGRSSRRRWVLCSPSIQPRRRAPSAGAGRESSAFTTSCGLAAMPSAGRQTRPISFGSGQMWTSGNCGSGAVGKVYDWLTLSVSRSPSAIIRSERFISSSSSFGTLMPI